MAEQRWPGHAVLQVPVQPLDAFVRTRFEHYDPSLVGASAVAGEDFVHAHVTILGPFDQLPDVDRISALAARLVTFEALANRVAVFDSGIIHAVAEPASDFAAWMGSAQAVFPEVEPYRGHFDVAPHITLDALGPGVDQAWVARQVALPVVWWADALDLVWYEQDATRLVARWRP